MKRFTTPTHLDSDPLLFQVGALLGYYRGSLGCAEAYRSLSRLDAGDILGTRRVAFQAGVRHGLRKREEDQRAGKVVPL